MATEMAGLKAEASRGKTCYVRRQRAQEGTTCGSSKAVPFCVGQGVRGENSAALALQRQLLLDSGLPSLQGIF